MMLADSLTVSLASVPVLRLLALLLIQLYCPLNSFILAFISYLDNIYLTYIHFLKIYLFIYLFLLSKILAPGQPLH